ncbi:restriction endonuclease-like protein [Paenibacillus hamazuiensis]|uniref:restriction endonuclease-like protein n=1 Tax=Paenibacillus hamazuiensis TaxID=2936508 RepID=UPI00200D81D4|nr:restriction endonuclease-like protein [Paenibacillus hamazuiensis]
MASLPTGSLNQSVELLRIETNLFNLYLQGKPFHPTVETLHLHRQDNGWVEASFHASEIGPTVQIERVSMFSPMEDKLVPWSAGAPGFPVFFETQSYELVIEKKEECSLTFHHDNVHLRQSVRSLGKMILSGILNFQNEVGLTELEIRLEGAPVFRLQLEIFPTKMDYKNDYQAILNDVNEQIYNLSFDFLRKTFHLTGLKETRHQSLTEFFAILQHIFDQLVQAVERIKMSPHSKLQVENRLMEASRVKKAGRENVAFLTKRPHLLVRDDQSGFIPVGSGSFRPTHALESKRHVDFDTAENRFVRWVLVRIQQKLRDLKVRLEQKGRADDPMLARKLALMQGQLHRLLKHDFLDVGEMKHMTVSLVLQMAPGYRDVYRNYLMLMKGLSIQSDLFRLSMKDLAQLYEYWCFLKIHHLLSKKYELVKQDIIRVNRTGLFVTLDKSQKAKMVYRNPRNGEVFTLYYNALPSEDRRTTTTSQRPDNVLTLKKNDAAVEYKYIFDAKYRLNPAYEGTPYHEKYHAPGPEEDDINTMHRYRDAIVYLDGQGKEFERSMFGAYVLFPYHDEEAFQGHHFYRSIELVNVGAFPFLPQSTSLIEKFLDEIILDSPEKAFERSTQPRGTKEYYRNKLSGKNMVIGSLSKSEQLDAALRFKFYHTPLKNITDHRVLTQLEYVALYQSIQMFGRQGNVGITYYGKIKEWKVVPRKAITHIPSSRGATDELYVVFSVEEWLSREKPIVPGGHGIHRLLYTSKYSFDLAKEVAELRLDSEEQLKEWRQKRRLGAVKVKLDREYVDLARQVVGIEVET